LTNKIYSYSQAGLFVLATDTQQQDQFILENQNLGKICKQNSQDIENKINEIFENIEIIRKNKKSRFEYSQSLSFDNESQKLIEISNKIL